jgi:S-adenosylmethionine:tRNA ribosyltransferase-isomerase
MISMKTADFNYDLPESLIASRPPAVRGQSRLLVIDRRTGLIIDRSYADLTNYLDAGDTLVLNDTKVFPARVSATTEQKTYELILLEEVEVSGSHHISCLVRGKIKIGQILTVGSRALTVIAIELGGTAKLSSPISYLELADEYGTVPLPPYMRRKAEENDIERYQTVFAETPGSAAAPTASLNMTPELIRALQAKGVVICYVTLHVGIGTFLPIRTDELQDHQMHTEHFVIPQETMLAIQTSRKLNNKIVALGTTVCRTLEANANELLHSTPQRLIGQTNIFMYPGYNFQLVDHLMTNFHAPSSTVLMMAAAFAGWPLLKSAYEHAVATRYQFLSYGDTTLIL